MRTYRGEIEQSNQKVEKSKLKRFAFNSMKKATEGLMIVTLSATLVAGFTNNVYGDENMVIAEKQVENKKKETSEPKQEQVNRILLSNDEKTGVNRQIFKLFNRLNIELSKEESIEGKSNVQQDTKTTSENKTLNEQIKNENFQDTILALFSTPKNEFDKRDVIKKETLVQAVKENQKYLEDFLGKEMYKELIKAFESLNFKEVIAENFDLEQINRQSAYFLYATFFATANEENQGWMNEQNLISSEKIMGHKRIKDDPEFNKINEILTNYQNFLLNPVSRYEQGKQKTTRNVEIATRTKILTSTASEFPLSNNSAWTQGWFKGETYAIITDDGIFIDVTNENNLNKAIERLEYGIEDVYAPEDTKKAAENDLRNLKRLKESFEKTHKMGYKIEIAYTLSAKGWYIVADANYGGGMLFDKDFDLSEYKNAVGLGGGGGVQLTETLDLHARLEYSFNELNYLSHNFSAETKLTFNKWYNEIKYSLGLGAGYVMNADEEGKIFNHILKLSQEAGISYFVGDGDTLFSTRISVEEMLLLNDKEKSGVNVMISAQAIQDFHYLAFTAGYIYGEKQRLGKDTHEIRAEIGVNITNIIAKIIAKAVKDKERRKAFDKWVPEIIFSIFGSVDVSKETWNR